MTTEIVRHRPDLAPAFARLNREWLERFFIVVLDSNSRLGPAIGLYESMGFEHRPFPGVPRYVDADVYMELNLAR